MDYKLLITGLYNNDYAARKLAGDNDAVIFKLGYTPPYEKFEELKRLQLKTKDIDLFSIGKSYIIMDISEWVGHENEEYFVITMKFLHDHAYKWQYIFTVDNYGMSKVKSMLNMLSRHLKGEVIEQYTDKSKESESDYGIQI